MNIKKYIQKNCSSLKNKHVVITGATGGLGKEICLMLASLNANITLACRNKSLADSLAATLKQVNPNITVNFIPLNLQDLQSVNNCIKEIKKLNGIDILINNAGVYNVPITKTELGYNNIFQINFVSTYYLTRELMPELQKKQNSTCITLGSIAHNYSKTNLADPDFSTSKKPSKIYGNSKRFLMFSLFELFKNSKVNLAIVHPGVTLTNMTNHYPKAINWLVKIGIKLLFPSPKKATLSVILATNTTPPYLHWIGPGIFNIWGKPKVQKLNTATSEEIDEINKTTEDIYNQAKQYINNLS